MNLRRKHWPPDPPGVQASEIICCRTTPFILAPGNPLRAATCLACGQAAAGELIAAFTVIDFHRPAHQCGMFTVGGWVIHEHHPLMLDERLARIAIERHEHCQEETR